MITTTNYNSQKLSLGSLQSKKSRVGKKYQNIPILYDGRKALVHLCGRFVFIPDLAFGVSSSGKYVFIDEAGITDNAPDYSFSGSGFCYVAIEVDADNRKLFEDFEKKIQSEVFESAQTKQRVGKEVKLIKKNNRVYLKIYFDEGKPVPKFWKVYEEDGEEKKKRILDPNSLEWERIEGEIVFSIANIFVGRNNKSDRAEPKSIICVAKEILVREIIKDEKSYFSYPIAEDDEVSE